MFVLGPPPVAVTPPSRPCQCSEGGALYALGLIYANHGQDVRSFLLESLRATSHEVTQHGACLGLGACVCGLAGRGLRTRARA